MISKLTLTNFLSFKTKNEVSFKIDNKDEPTYFDVDITNNVRLNKILCVIGAGGSGKTHLLKALTFLTDFITNSSPEQNPNLIRSEAHMTQQDKPTELQLEFYVGDILYRYELKLFKQLVVREALYKKTSRQFSYVFIRENESEQINFQSKKIHLSRALIDSYQKTSHLLVTPAHLRLLLSKTLLIYSIMSFTTSALLVNLPILKLNLHQ